MVSRAIVTEIRAGNGAKGDRSIDDYVLLDATHLGKDVLGKKLPDIASFCRTYLGIDPAEKPIPVQPTAHYAMGGIPTDLEGRVVATATERSTRGSTRRANAPASRCTARTVWEPTASSISSCSAGGRAGTSPGS